MRVKIGKYVSWIGPYQIAEMILFWKNKETDDTVSRFGEWLATNRNGGSTWLMKVCEWIYSKRSRKMSVKIDPWDTWNSDETLALIILPLLKEIRKNKQGTPAVEDSDVPESLRRNNSKPHEDDDVDELWFDRFNWVLDEMIWAFEQVLDPEDDSKFFNRKPGAITSGSLEDMVATIEIDHEGLKAHEARIKNGLTLFGKYFQTLWT